MVGLTWGDRLIGATFVTGALLAALCAGYVAERRGRRLPWILPAGTAIVGGSLLIPFLPLALVGCLVIGVEIYLRKTEI